MIAVSTMFSLKIKQAVHLLSTLSKQYIICCADSNRVALRRPEAFTYRCFLPDLTGFVMSCRAGPDHQRHSTKTACQDQSLEQEFDPAIAGCGYRAPLAPHLARPALDAIITSFSLSRKLFCTFWRDHNLASLTMPNALGRYIGMLAKRQMHNPAFVGGHGL